MATAINQPIQKIIKTVRLRILLRNLYKQLNIWLMIAVAALAILIVLQLIYHAITLPFIVTIIILPLLLQLAYELIFHRQSDETMCKNADKLLGTKSLILTAWDTSTTKASYLNSRQFILQQVEQSFAEWQTSLRKLPLIKINKSAYILIVCILCEIALTTLVFTIYHHPAQVVGNHAGGDLLRSRPQVESQSAVLNTAKQIRALLKSSPANTRHSERPAIANTSQKNTDMPSTSRATAMPDTRPTKNSMHSTANVSDQQERARISQGVNQSAKSVNSHGSSSMPGTDTVNNNNTQPSHSHPAVQTVSTPIYLNEANNFSILNGSNQPVSSSKLMGAKANTVLSTGRKPDLSSTAAAHYDADYPLATRAYINSYKSLMRQHNDRLK